ncbi:MAG: excinuclease ABC subunit UvrA [Flavobacteriales bacterium]|nr:excinuclease ABC subunit UvrA [Flavobacteriales bacterium]
MPKKKNKTEIDKSIIIKGAKLHNLKNIDVEIPRNSLTVITGVSGSGKSSLAFDTLYAEGQRRYVESLSSYARQFMGKLEKPDVEYIHGISPAIAIEQKVITRNPRSTVGTSTEIYDYLKILFERIRKIFSPISNQEVTKDSITDVVDYILSFKNNTKGLIYLKYVKASSIVLEQLIEDGFSRCRINNEFIPLSEVKENQDFDLIIDRFSVTLDDEDFKNEISDSTSTAFNEVNGESWIDIYLDDKIQSKHFSNKLELDGLLFTEPSPEIFNFNSPIGACSACEGFGKILGISEDLVVPDKNLSVNSYCVAPWKGPKIGGWRKQLVNNAHYVNFPVHTPYKDLTQKEVDLLWNGCKHFQGIHDFFDELQAKIYKIQNRVMISRYKGKTHCHECQGYRLKKESLAIKVGEMNIAQITNLTIEDAYSFFLNLKLSERELKIGKRLLEEITNRLAFLINVGVGYISLNRLSNSLSGGESQRINLASRLGSSLVGSLYVLDEPSIGLHPKDTNKLISVLKGLNQIGNTVVIVEHDEEIMRAASHIIDIGPKAGAFGGEVVFEGDHEKLLKSGKSLTTKYLNGELKIEIPKKKIPKKYLELRNSYSNNLDIPSVKIALGCLTVITGVSGSGKSSLVKNELIPEVKTLLNSGENNRLSGDLNWIESIEYVDQNPIGKSSRSNPATYVKAFDEIRNIFTKLPMSKLRGYKPSHFSLNVPNGRCEKCQGEGHITIEMQFMADLKLKCEECKGKRYKDEVLEVEFNGKNIFDILNLSIEEAITFFKQFADPTRKTSLEGKLVSKLIPLQKVGLGYIKLGQSSSTLSGGEAQRVKLAYFLTKGNNSDKTLFVFDEPTTGLHFHDISLLLNSFYALIDQGHSLIVIEHNPEIMKCASWIIDLGPGGGKNGGNLTYAGTPEKISIAKHSLTAQYVLEKLT